MSAISQLSQLVIKLNSISTTLFYLEGRIKVLQEERDNAALRLDQLRWAQRDAHENGHKWPGPEPKELEAAKVAFRDAKMDLEEARGDQARFLGDLNEARKELQVMKLAHKRAARNRPLTGKPFAALLG